MQICLLNTITWFISLFDVLVLIQVMIVLILVVLILLLSLCLLQRYTKQVAEAQGVEISLRNSLR